MSTLDKSEEPADALWVRCTRCDVSRRLLRYHLSDNSWYISGTGSLRWIGEFLRDHNGWDGNHYVEFGMENDDHWWNPNEADDE